jgi:hypothetical protein
VLYHQNAGHYCNLMMAIKYFENVEIKWMVMAVINLKDALIKKLGAD